MGSNTKYRFFQLRFKRPRFSNIPDLNVVSGISAGASVVADEAARLHFSRAMTLPSADPKKPREADLPRPSDVIVPPAAADNERILACAGSVSIFSSSQRCGGLVLLIVPVGAFKLSPHLL